MDMEMDWDNPLSMFLPAEVQQQQQSHDDVVDNEEGFYGEQEQAQQHVQQSIAHADAQPGVRILRSITGGWTDLRAFV